MAQTSPMLLPPLSSDQPPTVTTAASTAVATRSTTITHLTVTDPAVSRFGRHSS